MGINDSHFIMSNDVIKVETLLPHHLVNSGRLILQASHSLNKDLRKLTNFSDVFGAKILILLPLACLAFGNFIDAYSVVLLLHTKKKKSNIFMTSIDVIINYYFFALLMCFKSVK